MLYGGKHVIVTEHPSYVSGGYPPPWAQEGTVWYDSGQGKLVVRSNNSWVPLHTNGNVSLDDEAVRAIDWATAKMAEEKRRADLVDKYPMVASALHEFETVLKLHENLDNGDQGQ
jgi:hypothetical protein